MFPPPLRYNVQNEIHRPLTYPQIRTRIDRLHLNNMLIRRNRIHRRVLLHRHHLGLYQIVLRLFFFYGDDDGGDDDVSDHRVHAAHDHDHGVNEQWNMKV